MIIGIVGQIACGKGVLVDYLKKKFGFVSISLSSIVHEELEKRGIKEFTRKTLQDIGDELRKKYGRDVLVKRAIKKLSLLGPAGNFPPADARFEKYPSTARHREPFHFRHPANFIIEGIRNPSEVEYLKSLKNSVIIGIKATRKLRFDRLLKRKKPWDPRTWEEFVKVDRRDLGVNQQNSGQQVGKCLAYCDYVLTNNKDKRDFERKVEKIMKKILK